MLELGTTRVAYYSDNNENCGDLKKHHVRRRVYDVKTPQAAHAFLVKNSRTAVMTYHYLYITSTVHEFDTNSALEAWMYGLFDFCIKLAFRVEGSNPRPVPF